MQRPLLVLISGAPGSGKTTLARLLADELRVPHVNKDRIRDGLWLTDPSLADEGERVWELWMASVTRLLAAGVCVVADQTLYRGRSEAEIRTRLFPLGQAVNVHTRCPTADARWRAKLIGDDRWGREKLDELFEKAPREAALWTEPLDLGCPVIEVDTTDGYAPSIEALVKAIRASWLGRAA